MKQKKITFEHEDIFVAVILCELIIIDRIDSYQKFTISLK